MRKEIAEIIEKVKNRNDQPESPNGSPSILSETEQANIARMVTKQETLIAAMQSSLPATLVQVGTATSIDIEWLDSSIEIVIELSLEENLVAVFTYGDVSSKPLADIDSCLLSNNLLKLSDNEISMLEKVGLYRRIF